MGKVAVGLTLQSHSIEFCSHVALWAGLVKRGPADLAQLGGHVKWQDTLKKRWGLVTDRRSKTEKSKH